MSELGDDFRAMREVSQKKRKHNRAESLALLNHTPGLVISIRNGGAHLIVEYERPAAFFAGIDRPAERLVVDFWPGTGRWLFRGDKAKHANGQGRGVFEMLKALGISKR